MTDTPLDCETLKTQAALYLDFVKQDYRRYGAKVQLSDIISGEGGRLVFNPETNECEGLSVTNSKNYLEHNENELHESIGNDRKASRIDS